ARAHWAPPGGSGPRPPAPAPRPAGGAPGLAREPPAPQAVEENLAPRPPPPLPEIVRVTEDRRDVLHDLRRLVGGHEHVDPAREARRVREAAADPDVEAWRAAVAHRAGEGEVVDEPARAVLGAAGDGDLVLGREVRVDAVVEEPVVDRERGGAAVHHLAVADAGERAADDVPRDVAAGAGSGEPDRRQPLEDAGDLLEPDPVDLRRLARGAVDDP